MRNGSQGHWAELGRCHGLILHTVIAEGNRGNAVITEGMSAESRAAIAT